MCFAKHGDLTFEIMEPISGESLMAEYLDQVSVASSSGRKELTGRRDVGKEVCSI